MYIVSKQLKLVDTTNRTSISTRKLIYKRSTRDPITTLYHPKQKVLKRGLRTAVPTMRLPRGRHPNIEVSIMDSSSSANDSSFPT